MAEHDLSPDMRDAERQEVIDGLISFVERYVQPLQSGLSEFWADPRRYFGADGTEAPEVVAARRSVRQASASAGYYTMFTPPELGGVGLGHRLYFEVIETINHRYGPGQPAEQLAADVIANWFTGPGPIWLHASPALRSAMLPDLNAGAVHGCFALSEAEAGSDVWGIQTTAQPDGDGWVITGSKQWASWSSHADFALVFAVTDPAARAARKGGITCFCVPADTPGYQFQSVIPIFGEPGGREGILSLTEVRVPDTHRIGPLGQGLTMAFLTLTRTRLWMAAQSSGQGRWALDRGVAYAAHRRTFGKAIAEHQSVQDLLADSAVDLAAVRAMALDCADKADRGFDVRAETAMCKLFATNAAFRVFDRMIQVHGGIGVASELRLVDGWKLARLGRITEGSDEIMRRTIVKELLK
jgi:acyl-CoA dehydrogenase